MDPQNLTHKPAVTKISDKSRNLLLIGIAIFILFMILGIVGVFALWNNRSKNNVGPSDNVQITIVPTTMVPTVLPSITPTLIPSVISTAIPTTKPTVKPTTPPASISGSLSYPSEYYPAMKICAVNTSSHVETCINTKEGQSTYTISNIKPGNYRVYAEGGIAFHTYYTKCDTYDNSQELPQCNSNVGGGDNWSSGDFKCYEDAVCKAAYTPLIINVAQGQKVQLKRLIQGWYIPCNDSEPCNDPNYDVWKNYMK